MGVIKYLFIMCISRGLKKGWNYIKLFLHCNPFCLFSAKFGICTVVSLCKWEHLLEIKFVHFILNKCPIYNHEGASAKFNTNLT